MAKYSEAQVKFAVKKIKSVSKRGDLDKVFEDIAKELGCKKSAIHGSYYNEDGWLKKAINGIENIRSNSYSKNEIDICLAMIKLHPDNLSHAFRLASEKTGRSANSIMLSWYSAGGALNNIKSKKSIFSLTSFFGFFKSNSKNNVAKGKLSL